VPRSEQSYVAASQLWDQVQPTFALVEKSISVQSGYLQNLTDLRDLTFSGRVFLYHEDNFSLRQLADLVDIYKSHGMALDFRGPGYLGDQVAAWYHSHDRTPPSPTQKNVSNKPTQEKRKTLSDLDYVNPPKDGSAPLGGWRRLRLDQAEALGIWLGQIKELTAVRILASAKDPEAWEFASEFVRVIKMTPRLTLVGGGMTDRQTEGQFGLTVMLGKEQEWNNLFSAQVEAAFARSFITVIGRGVDNSLPSTQIDIIVGAAKRQL
jgi:hypothetical protein